jgi:Na+/glutamate symporter
MQYSINALIALTIVLATSVEAKKGLHGKGFTGDGVLGAGADFAGGVVGGVLGGVVARRGIHERRQMNPLDSVPQYNYDMCRESLNGAKLSFTPGGPGSFQVAGVPSTCMVLATVLTGSFNAGYPTPMGADSLKFTGLTNEELSELQSYFH